MSKFSQFRHKAGIALVLYHFDKIPDLKVGIALLLLALMGFEQVGVLVKNIEFATL